MSHPLFPEGTSRKGIVPGDLRPPFDLWPSGRHVAEYSDASRQADNAMREVFMRRLPLERERFPASCIPSGSGAHRQVPFGLTTGLDRMHGLLTARRYRGLS